MDRTRLIALRHRLAALGRRLRDALRRLAGRARPLWRRYRHRLRAAAQPSPSLRALTAAALALPGLAPVHAGDQAGFQYSRYEEGERELFGEPSIFDPIQVDSLHGSGGVTLFDRVKFYFNYLQDTWSGATPIATAPLAFAGNRSIATGGDSVSGASPYISSGNLFFDSRFNPYTSPFLATPPAKETRLVHTLSSASPETRKQGDFKLGYEWNEAALEVGAGVSLEPDYESRWGSANGRWDLNQKLTTLNLGLSYTHSDIEAELDHDAFPYFDASAYADRIDLNTGPDGSVRTRTLRDQRQDWSARVGLSQVLNKNSFIETSLGYTRSTGFLENNYKVVQLVFVDPDQAPEDFGVPGLPPLRSADVEAVLEQRPDLRNQWSWNTRYVQHVAPWDAALHLGYRYFHDDWGINAHAFEAAWGQPLGEGWTITPRVRYYTQDEADFYRPYFLFKQAVPRTLALPPDFSTHIDYGRIPISDYSSDHRLSGYGALSGGVTVSKEFARGAALETGMEYYTHEGGLKLGGGGETDYADFDYLTFNVGLRVDLSAALSAAESGFAPAQADRDHANRTDTGHMPHSGGHAPAGVMFDHLLPEAGDFMVGYRYMYARQDGDTLRGTDAASDREIRAEACGADGCTSTSVDMDMHMHMLDLMYAPTEWLNLMLMPQFLDMDMTLRALEGAPPDRHAGHGGHATGGVGDTSLFALFKLFDSPGHHLHLALGVSAPTGAVDEKLRRTHQEDRGFIHYHMQLGSGTWDFRPSLTYTGHADRLSWGGQVSGTRRLEDENASGYALGDLFQATAWSSYGLAHWLSASVRGVYTHQGQIEGEFDGLHEEAIPLDLPRNYGGQYWDVGFGLNAEAVSGDLKGNRVGVEWLHPVEDNVNGYQVEREGTLFATWSLKF